jgi:predicted amidophosphoribosyltransferase
MLFFKQVFLTPVCICCGSFFCGPALFCISCYETVIAEKLCAQQECRSHIGGRHFYLFEWNSFDSDEFSQLVYRLKSNNSEAAMRHYGELLLSKMRDLPGLAGFAGIVPVPSANAGSVHAHILAGILAKALQLPYLDLLVKEGEADQKTLSASERSHPSNTCFRMRPDEVFTGETQALQKYILVDDVLTTGQSFKQASAALGGHASTVIATLFYRTKTATPLS